MTYFGQAAYCVTFELMMKIEIALASWNPAHDYTRIVMPKYFDTVNITLSNGTEKKYHYHKLMYGPTKTICGKNVFRMRTDDEGFWLSQWGCEYSPFRIIQRILKDNGLYLVDHTFSGYVPFVYIYKFLPPRGVIKTIPWHGYQNLPNLNHVDYESPKLTSHQILTAFVKAYIQLQIKFAPFMETIKKTSYKIESTPVLAVAPIGIRTYRDAVASSNS